MSSPVRIKKSRTEIADTIRRAHYKACWGIEPLASWRSITTAYQQQIWLSCADAVISAIESDRREVHESGEPTEPNVD